MRNLLSPGTAIVRHSTHLALMAALAALGCSDPAAPKEIVAVHGCDRAVVYSVGQTMRGAIDNDECAGPGGSPADYYALTLEESGPLRITARTSDPQALSLYLLVPTGEVVRGASGDDALHVGGTILAGNYIVAVEANRREGRPAYTLSSAAEYPPVNGCASVATLALRTTVTAQIATTDCRHQDANTFIDHYAVELPLATGFNATVVPAGTDSLVGGILFEGGFVYVMDTLVRGVDSTFGGGLNRGRYFVFVTGIRAGQTMSYTVRADTAGSFTPPATHRAR